MPLMGHRLPQVGAAEIFLMRIFYLVSGVCMEGIKSVVGFVECLW